MEYGNTEKVENLIDSHLSSRYKDENIVVLVPPYTSHIYSKYKEFSQVFIVYMDAMWSIWRAAGFQGRAHSVVIDSNVSYLLPDLPHTPSGYKEDKDSERTASFGDIVRYSISLLKAHRGYCGNGPDYRMVIV